jgi:hypothetical protein
MSVPGAFWVESEFTNGLNATCGPCARAMAVSWALQAYQGSLPGQTATYRSYLRMRALGDCDLNGASNGGGVRHSLEADGFKTARQGGAGWLAFARARFAEPAVVVAELSAGHNLRDTITGLGMDAGPTLAYHWHTWLDYHPGGYSARAGKSLPEGIWCADGDSDATNPVVAGRRTRVVAGHALQFYTIPTLSSAAPVDLIAVYPKVAFNPGGGAGVKIPSGWTDDGHHLWSPNGAGYYADLGFRDAILHAGEPGAVISEPWDPGNWILRPPFGTQSVEPGNPAIGAGTRIDCRWLSLGWTTSRGVYRIYAGQDLLAMQQHIDALITYRGHNR